MMMTVSVQKTATQGILDICGWLARGIVYDQPSYRFPR